MSFSIQPNAVRIMAGEQLKFDWSDDPDEDRKKLPPKRDPAHESQTVHPLTAIQPLGDRLRSLRDRGVYVGTSSWKYEGWLGRVYDPARYQTRGRFSKKKFEQGCLAEYASIFATVGGDFAFYQFPSESYWRELFSQIPPGFRMSLKIPEDVTIVRFPDLPRYGKRAGKMNPDFMNPQLVEDQLLTRLAPYRDRLGVLMFEFGTIHDGEFSEPARFAEGLHDMLSRLPTDQYQFAVEVRNSAFLQPDPASSESLAPYLAALRANRTAHCFNSWTRMPPVTDQLIIPGILTADHIVARFLLRPGRSYQQAVTAFSPYDRTRDPYPEGRTALRMLIEQALETKKQLYAFVNNRLEGSAVDTIEAVLAQWI